VSRLWKSNQIEVDVKLRRIFVQERERGRYNRFEKKIAK
jgi:hypothetical protein